MPLNIIVKNGQRGDKRVNYDPKRRDLAMQSQRPDLRVSTRHMDEASSRYWNQKIIEGHPGCR